MSRYMLIYNGKATDPSQMSPDDAAKVMEGWRTWIGTVGPALADVGTPFGQGTWIVDDGSSAEAIELSGVRPDLKLEPLRVVEAPGVTHLKYRVVKYYGDTQIADRLSPPRHSARAAHRNSG